MSTTFLEECVAVLTRTPEVLDTLLRDLPEGWTSATEGEGTWSAFHVIGHLIHVEHADWIPRLSIILEDGPSRAFDPVDREAHFRQSAGRSLHSLLADFQKARRESLQRLRESDLKDADLERQGTHPKFGLVTARQLLATWTAHDLAHLLQISRVMAKRFRGEVGPWAEFLSVMK